MNSSKIISTYKDEYKYVAQSKIVRVSSAGTLRNQGIFPVLVSENRSLVSIERRRVNQILPSPLPFKMKSMPKQADTVNRLYTEAGASNALSVSQRSPASNNEIVDEIIQKINVLFPEPARSIYRSSLQKSQDVNSQYDGFSLLHYCVYCFSSLGKSSENKFLDLIQYLIEHNAQFTKDQYGRTPIYFASSTNPRYWDLISSREKICDFDNKLVHPLHVIASFEDKFVYDLVERGVNMDVVDKFGRTPLHCAVLHEDFHEGFFNTKCLVEYAPKSLEHADCFGNYPLNYAALFGSNDLFEFVLKHSSRTAVQCVLDSFKVQNSLNDPFELKKGYGFNDPIYNVPPPLRIMYGGGSKGKKQHRDVRTEKLHQALQEKKRTISLKGVEHDAYHDGHGFKHCIHQNDYNRKYKNDKSGFIKSTESGAAKFYPLPCYDDLVYSCVENWVKSGACMDKPYVKFPRPIGADNGKETDVAEIYFSSSGGAHVRPKDIQFP